MSAPQKLVGKASDKEPQAQKTQVFLCSSKLAASSRSGFPRWCLSSPTWGFGAALTTLFSPPRSAAVMSSSELSGSCYYLLLNQIPHKKKERKRKKKKKKKRSRKPPTKEEGVFQVLSNTHTDPHSPFRSQRMGGRARAVIHLDLNHCPAVCKL